MPERDTIRMVLGGVADALLDKGEGYSIGKLVATLEGDGTATESDPYHVFDIHFYRDVSKVNEWREEPRDPQEVTELLDLFEEYWRENPEKRFCQIICQAHVVQNGLGEFSPEETPYEEPLDELTDEQLREYLESQFNNE